MTAKEKRDKRRAEFLAEQGGRCAICGTDDPGSGWHLDHDHRHCGAGGGCDECWRGVLCTSCNVGIGMLGDSRARLLRAAEYVAA